MCYILSGTCYPSPSGLSSFYSTSLLLPISPLHSLFPFYCSYLVGSLGADNDSYYGWCCPLGHSSAPACNGTTYIKVTPALPYRLLVFFPPTIPHSACSRPRGSVYSRCALLTRADCGRTTPGICWFSPLNQIVCQ